MRLACLQNRRSPRAQRLRSEAAAHSELLAWKELWRQEIYLSMLPRPVRELVSIELGLAPSVTVAAPIRALPPVRA